MKTHTCCDANSQLIPTKQRDILFIKDIAVLFDISPTTLRRKKWRKRTQIPFHKIGKKLCCSRVEIETWFKAQKG